MNTTMSLKELGEAIAQKSKLSHTVFEEAGADLDFSKVKCLGDGDTKAKVEKVQALNKELTDLKADWDALRAIDAGRRTAQDMSADFNKPEGMTFPGKGDKQPEIKSLGALIMEAKGKWYKNPQPTEIKGIELKTLFETTAGWAAESVRMPRVELYPARALVVADYVPQIPVSQAAVVYMEETTATFNALEKGEGLAYAESAFALTQRTVTVRKVTTSLPITDEQLDDVPAAEAYINQRIGYDIRRRLDLQILNGLGSGGLLLGTTQIGGSLQTQALGTDPVPDAIYKLFDKIRTVGFTEPGVLFIHPNDWQPVRLLRTADGIYIFGNPSDPGAKTIWGVPVVQTTAVTENTAVAGDYTGFSALYVRKGLEVSMGWTGSQFTEGEKTLRADIRVAMVHFRTSAFGTITGI